MNLGKSIKDLRKKKGITQNDFCAECGITQAYLSQIENNLKDPNLSTLKVICEKLDIPLPILFFISIDESDIPDSKKDAFKIIKPLAHNIISGYFTV